ncbi:putative alginate O-acetylase AlgI [Desulfovibrionales bacterium]
MAFTSTVFLFLFLPVLLGFYWFTPRPAKNILLLTASLTFYAWGEIQYLWVLASSILVNYGLALAIDYAGKTQTRNWLLTGGIVGNLGLLVWFKYVTFCVDNLNFLLAALQLPTIKHYLPVGLPLGISFFTFSVLSCLLDVYRGQTRPRKNLLEFALFVSFFPKIINGPICRFANIDPQLNRHPGSLNDFSYGARRFILGLGKKMILANTLSQTTNSIMILTIDQLTTPLAWAGIICYTLQIYFDFSGYSDMAVGLGRFFGLRLMENFDQPYIATSIRDFWRRWHISLSSWFRDYLYIPLGGNRVPTFRIYFNLWIVFLLCGLWHGGSWNFVIWGAIHGFCIVIERFDNGRIHKRLPILLQHGYTLLVVLVAWVFFRIETFTEAINYLRAMIGLGKGNGIEHNIWLYLDREWTMAFVAAVAMCIPWAPRLARIKTALYRHGQIVATIAEVVELAGLSALWVTSVLYVAAGTYNPFIYLRF